jgi:Fe-S-cluster-containing hydrogenase component 2
MRPVLEHKFSVDQEKCIRCGECVNDCPANILVLGDETPALAAGRERDCIGCQHCLAVCPTGAVSVLGLQATDSLVLEGNLPSYNQLEHLLKGRRSVRRYSDENLDPTLLKELLETAWHAPSGRNGRQVQFTVIDDREVMNQIRNRTMDTLADITEKESLPQGFEFYKKIISAWQEHQADMIFRWAPHLLITSAPRTSPSLQQDTIIALSYFEMICHSAGIGTLWNGMVKTTMTLVPELWEMLALPDDHQLGFAMGFGRPAVSYTRTVQYRNPLINRVKPLGD